MANLRQNLVNKADSFLGSATKALDTAKAFTGDKLAVVPKMSSIASEAAKSTYYFPILVSNTVGPKSVNLLAANLEYVYAYFMRATFALTPAIKVKGDAAENGIRVEEYLKRFHQNSGIAANSSFGVVLKEDLEPAELLKNAPLNESLFGLNNFTLNNLNKFNNDLLKFNNDLLTMHTNVNDDSLSRAINDALRQQKNAIEAEKNAKKEDEEDPEEARLKRINAKFTSNDADKKNQMAPLVIPVTASFLVDTHEIKVNIPVGIKTVIHSCNSEDIIDRLTTAMSGGMIKNFVKWTTGEVESLADTLFNLKDLKKNVRGETEVDKWFDVIERRSRMNKLSFGMGSKKPFLPNMTIHISTNDVYDIERKTHINLIKKPNVVAKLVKNTYLLAFVITDDANETAYIMYDGHSVFTEMPFTSIKRETEKGNDLVGAMLKQMAR